MGKEINTVRCLWRLRPYGEVFYSRYNTVRGCIESAEEILRFNADEFRKETIYSDAHGQNYRELANILLSSPTMLFVAHAPYYSSIRYYAKQDCVKLVASEALENLGVPTIQCSKEPLIRNPYMLELKPMGFVPAQLSTASVPINYIPRIYAVIAEEPYAYTRYGKKKLDFKPDLDEFNEGVCFLGLKEAIDSNAYAVVCCNGKPYLVDVKGDKLVLRKELPV